jgi:hypothetical protein
MTATTSPTPSAWATLARKPKSTNHLAKSSPRVAPEKAPDKTPTKVMPICTVERKRPGSVASASARREPMTWRSTSACNRARREDTIASSASANRPLRRISATTIARRGHGGERHLHLCAEQVIQCKGDAAVRHVNNVNAGHDFEQLAGHVGWRHKIRQRRPLVAHHGPCTCGQRSGPSVRYAPMMALAQRAREWWRCQTRPARSAAGRWIGWPIFFLAVASRGFAPTCALIAAQHIAS